MTVGHQLFSNGKQDLFEVMGPIPRNTLEDLRDPYCSARLPGLASPADEQEFDLPTSSGIMACPDGLKCQTDGYCRAETPSLLVLAK